MKYLKTTIREFLNEQYMREKEDLYSYIRSEEFKNWFGDWENDKQNSSKVIDENGEPLLVYHGSSDIFDIFDKKYRGSSTNSKSAKLGFFFY